MSEEERQTLLGRVNRLDRVFESKTVIAPGVVGLELREARRKLAQVGLKADEHRTPVEDRAMANRILVQDPVAGTRHERKKPVKLRVAIPGVRVPDLEAVHIDRAREVCGDDLTLKVRDQRITGRAVGTVLEQSPRAGTLVAVGERVEVVIEAKSVVVPNVEGVHEDDARAILSDLGLKLKVRDRWMTGDVDWGFVLKQRTPADKRVLPGSKVEVIVEAPSVAVPSVIGMVVGPARERLKGVHLQKVEEKPRLAERARRGEVVEQHPPPGKRVPPGERVTLWVAEPGVRVPDLRGLGSREAAGRLGEVGLRFGDRREVENKRYQENRIFSQQPGPGELVRMGSAVNVTIAKSGKVEVPRVIGLTEGQAAKRIREARLVPRTEYVHTRSEFHDKLVDEQDPPPHARVKPGTEVKIIIKCY
jgi:serine/threonine-protein kinase